MRIFQNIYYLWVLQFYFLRIHFAKFKYTQVKKKKNSIYFFSPFFSENAGYNWRVLKWKEVLEENGFHVKIGVATTKDEFHQLYPNENVKFQRKFMKRRFKQVIESLTYETVIVRRELLLFNDYGNLFFEKFLLHFHPNAILDFDDDIAASKGQPKKITNLYGKLMKENGDKFNSTIKLFNYFIPGTNYLHSRIQEQNKSVSEENICVIPTCIDYNLHPGKLYDSQKKIITFGWIGNSGNYFLLDQLLDDLNKLSSEYAIELLVIGGEKYDRKTSFPIRFKSWSLKSEIEDLKEIDLGLMPLIDNTISKGKAGFKLIQYMAMGVVSIASEITVNSEIIPDKTHGYLVTNNWYNTLKQGIIDKKNWPEMGTNSREHVLSNYSFEAKKKEYLDFIRFIQQKSNIE